MTRTSIAVGLAGRAYDVVIGHGLIDGAGAEIAPFCPARRVALVADAAVQALHGARLVRSLEAGGLRVDVITVAPGEASKSFEGLATLSDQLLALGLDRGDLIIAFGGGVVGDLAGFAAAIYKRGIDFVQIPTTLLAQVDSSVGGKTAIDTPRGKNLIGAFHQPRLVLADLSVLHTLNDREMRAGYAEVLKYGLLGDATFFDWLEAHTGSVLARQPDALGQAVAHCVAMKAQIVAEDERESGRRALLNLGHTFGHALEAEIGFDGALLHGEAVAIGCAQAFRFSAAQGLCRPQDAARVEQVIAASGLPTRLAGLPGMPFAAGDLLAHMQQDKKAEGGKLTFILAKAIGAAFTAKAVDSQAVFEFLVSEGARP
jgi:3-dehydroquinate synthase